MSLIQSKELLLQRAAYERFVYMPVHYRILKSFSDVLSILDDPRYWRIVETPQGAISMLRVPLQVKNNVLKDIQDKLHVRVAMRKELAEAFRSGPDHQYRYPWGDQLSARSAPFLLRANPNGMGMNLAGLYFNGPDNLADPDKNGLWMVTAERDAQGRYVSGDRSGTAGNVGIFDSFNPSSFAAFCSTAVLSESRAVLPENRGVLPEHQSVIPENRGQIVDVSKVENCLTPAGIGEDLELYPNEGYLMVRPLQPEELKYFRAAKQVLGRKVSADHGISGISIGYIGDAAQPIIVFGVFGHCLNCPNPRTLTMPINCPEIAKATGVPVIEYPEFEQHKVVGRQAIIPASMTGEIEKKRIYFP
jgi:hypothetical protein